MSDKRPWYKDRDFPEIKVSNAEILAVVENEEQLLKLIEIHNGVLDDLDEAKKKYLYLYAEFENFRKRNEKEKEDFKKYGHEKFLRELVQIVDLFDMAMEYKDSPFDFADGMGMVHKKLLDALKTQGVTQQPKDEKFDPNKHEAIAKETGEKGSIVRELEKGYTLHERLLRAAKVIVGE